LNDDIFFSDIFLSAKDLGTIGFPYFTDMDALPLSPPITVRLEARYQSGIKIYSVINPIHYRIFLAAPIRFHDLSLIIPQKKKCCAGCETIL
jgi:hypothetical protein